MLDSLQMLFKEYKSIYEAQCICKESKEILHKHYKIKNDDRIDFFCLLTTNDINYLKDFKIYGFWESLLKENPVPEDFFVMELGVKFMCSGNPIEIKRINAGINKRTGKGSAGISFLEESIIPAVNDILRAINCNNKVTYIYGISADLSPDTDRLSRAKFYSKNDFILNNSHFYKYL